MIGPFIPDIKALDQRPLALIRQRIDQKTKPPGSLGLLEGVAAQLALIQWPQAPRISEPTMLVFAGDHGIARHPVSIAPQAVTRQMVLNFLAGGAAINCFCRANDMRLKVVDAGILQPVDDGNPDLVDQRCGAGTRDFSEQAAMSDETCFHALASGMVLAQAEVANGCNLLAFGEMGIGNTSAAAALLALVESLPVDTAVGRGTGIDDQALALKQNLITQAVGRVQQESGALPINALTALQQVGGFEIVQLVGAMLGAARMRTAMLIDGFIVSVAALLACRLAPECRDYMLFAHRSAEQAHAMVLERLQAEPLLDLGLRLGEGTGAALALPLLRSACVFYNEMATFESAGVVIENAGDSH